METANNLKINKEKTCAVTGHRNLKFGVSKDGLRSMFKILIEVGFNCFLVGMAVGFDSLCFRLLEEIRKEKEITIIACVPCKGQSKNFSAVEKREYDQMIASADAVVMVSEEYTPYCMQKRNRYMVDNCNVLVAYLREKKGGTFNTVLYAEAKDVHVIKV